MKRLSFVVSAIAALAIAVPALAAVITNERVPLNQQVFVPCASGGNGDNVTLQGALHILDDVTVNGHILHVKQQFNPQDVSGIGSPSGARYRGTGVTETVMNLNFNGFPAETTFVNNFRVIGQGRAPNFTVHENAHISINTNGNVSTLFDDFRATCR